jgi:hypothetical protein
MISEVLQLCELESSLSRHCAKFLCRNGSEMQQEFRAGLSPTPICVTYDDNADPCAWIATRAWRCMQTIEGFVAPPLRRRGLAKIGVLSLLAERHLDKTKPVVVFAPACVELAYFCGFDDVRLYQRNEMGEWKEIKT